MEKLKTYYRHAKEELQKVIFPMKEQVRSAYFSVFIVVAARTVFKSAAVPVIAVTPDASTSTEVFASRAFN